jgi:hypothetical protein
MRLADVELQFLIDGAPAAEAYVDIRAEHAADASGGPVRSQHAEHTDRDGRVRYRTFAGTLYPQLSPHAGGHFHAPPLVVAAGDVRQVVSLQRARFELQLTTPDGAPAADVPVRFGGLGVGEATTDTAGRLRTGDFAAGRHPLLVRPRSLCEDGGRAYEQQFGWVAANNAWLALPDLDLRAGDNGVIAVRLPREWDR